MDAAAANVRKELLIFAFVAPVSVYWHRVLFSSSDGIHMTASPIILVVTSVLGFALMFYILGRSRITTSIRHGHQDMWKILDCPVKTSLVLEVAHVAMCVGQACKFVISATPLPLADVLEVLHLCTSLPVTLCPVLIRESIVKTLCALNLTVVMVLYFTGKTERVAFASIVPGCTFTQIASAVIQWRLRRHLANSSSQESHVSAVTFGAALHSRDVHGGKQTSLPDLARAQAVASNDTSDSIAVVLPQQTEEFQHAGGDVAREEHAERENVFGTEAEIHDSASDVAMRMDALGNVSFSISESSRHVTTELARAQLQISVVRYVSTLVTASLTRVGEYQLTQIRDEMELSSRIERRRCAAEKAVLKKQIRVIVAESNAPRASQERDEQMQSPSASRPRGSRHRGTSASSGSSSDDIRNSPSIGSHRKEIAYRGRETFSDFYPASGREIGAATPNTPDWMFKFRIYDGQVTSADGQKSLLEVSGGRITLWGGVVQLQGDLLHRRGKSQRSRQTFHRLTNCRCAADLNDFDDDTPNGRTYMVDFDSFSDEDTATIAIDLDDLDDHVPIGRDNTIDFDSSNNGDDTTIDVTVNVAEQQDLEDMLPSVAAALYGKR